MFHLTGPYGTFFDGALSLPLTAPVPKEFAAPLDKKKPTTFGSTYLVGTGPYMFKSDSNGKFLGIGYQPGKSATLVRNPNWDPNNSPVPAYLDQININIGGDTNVIGRQVLTGTHTRPERHAGAGAIIKLAYQKYYNQLVAVPGAGDHYRRAQQQAGPVLQHQRPQGIVGGARPGGDDQGRRRPGRGAGRDALHLPDLARIPAVRR